jgi:hypothetical protein
LLVGALHIADLGYFNLDRLAQESRRGVYWIIRLKAGTAVYTPTGERLDLLRWLRAQTEDQLDVTVMVGAQ